MYLFLPKYFRWLVNFIVNHLRFSWQRAHHVGYILPENHVFFCKISLFLTVDKTIFFYTTYINFLDQN